MITVGVRDLKNQLSRYLQYVKNGERVIITEHDRAIAEINILQKNDNISSIEEKLHKLHKEGKIIKAKRQNSCLKLPVIGEELDWKTIYNEIRSERI